MLPCVAAGASLVLAETCQLVLFDPTLLSCAKKRGVEPPRRNCYFTLARKYTRVCGPLCDPMGSSQVVLTLSGSPTVFYWYSLSGLQLQPGLQLIQRSDCRAANLTVFRRRKAFLLCKNPCGGLRWGWGPRRSRQRHRPRKEISRGNLLCAKSGLPSLSYPRLESAQKYVTMPDWSHVRVGQPRGARGTAVPLFREESRGTPSKGFLWATSSRRLDTALLFADKKRGVETYQAGRALPVETGACRHGRQQKLTVPPSQRQTPPAGGNSPAKPPARSCLPARTAPCRVSSPDILPGRDENHS